MPKHNYEHLQDCFYFYIYSTLSDLIMSGDYIVRRFTKTNIPIADGVYCLWFRFKSFSSARMCYTEIE